MSIEIVQLLGALGFGYALPELLILNGGQGRSPAMLNIIVALSIAAMSTKLFY